MPEASATTRLPDDAAARPDGIWTREDSVRFAIGLAAGGAALGAMASGSSTLVLALVPVLLLLAVVSPITGLISVAFLAPLAGKPILPAPGLIAFVLAGVLAGTVLRLVTERPRLRVSAPVLCGLGFVLYLAAQQLPAMLGGYSGDGLWTGSAFLRVVTGFLAVITAGLVLRGRRPLPVLLALVISAVIVAVLSILMLDNGEVPGPILNLIAEPEAGQRPSGVFSNPNYYGWFAATSLVLTLGLFIARIGWRMRALLLPALLILALGVAVSQSRGSFLSAAVGTALLVFTRDRRAGIITAGLAAVAAAVLIPMLIEWRLTNSIGSASIYARNVLADSDAGRLGAVLVGPRLFLTAPLFGVGLGNYVALSGTHSHNWYMSVLAEQGVVGVVLWGLVLVTAVLAVRRRTVTPRSIGYAVLATWSVSSLFLEPPFETQGSVPVAIVLAAVLVADWRALERSAAQVAAAVTRLPPWSARWPAWGLPAGPGRAPVLAASAAGAGAGAGASASPGSISRAMGSDPVRPSRWVPPAWTRPSAGSARRASWRPPAGRDAGTASDPVRATAVRPTSTALQRSSPSAGWFDAGSPPVDPDPAFNAAPAVGAAAGSAPAAASSEDRAGQALSMRSVGRSAVILTLGTLAAQAVIVIRELFLANEMGASRQVDALLVGTVLPVALGNMLASGSAVALVPAYLAVRGSQGVGRARRFSGVVLAWIALLGLAISSALWWAAPAIVSITGAGLGPLDQAQAADYLRVSAPSVFAFAVYGILASTCQAEERFAWLATTTVTISAVSVGIMLALWPQAGLMGYAVGGVVGPFVGVTILVLLLLRAGLAPRPVLRVHGMEATPFLRHALPLTISSAILQLNVVADTSIASRLAPGGVAALRYGQLLINVPVSAMGLAWSRAIYPALVHTTLDTGGSQLAATSSRVLRFVLAAFMPIAMLTAILAPVLVGLAFGRGAFSVDNIELTAQVVLGLSPIIVLAMVHPVFTGALNARRQGVILLTGGIINVTLNFTFDVIFGATLGVMGIALSSSCATTIVLMFFARRLSRLEPAFTLRPLARQLVRTIAAALPIALVLGPLVWSRGTGGGVAWSIAIGAVVSVVGLAGYLALATLFRVREPAEIIALVRGQLARRRGRTEGTTL